MDGWTPLHVSCHEGHLAMVRLLIDHHMDINHVTKKGETSMFIALSSHCRETAPDGATPLFMAGSAVPLPLSLTTPPAFTPSPNSPLPHAFSPSFLPYLLAFSHALTHPLVHRHFHLQTMT